MQPVGLQLLGHDGHRGSRARSLAARGLESGRPRDHSTGHHRGSRFTTCRQQARTASPICRPALGVGHVERKAPQYGATALAPLGYGWLSALAGGGPWSQEGQCYRGRQFGRPLFVACQRLREMTIQSERVERWLHAASPEWFGGPPSSAHARF